MNDPALVFAPPRRRMLLLESRAAVDVVRMAAPLVLTSLRNRRQEPGPPVIVVPGYRSDDRYMLPLRRYLEGNGFSTESWGLGRNLGGLDLQHTIDDLSEHWAVEDKPDYRGEAAVPYLCDRFVERVRERHAVLGVPITLVGWSLGGYLARETARDLPEIVDRVITLGAPVVGGPKYTATARHLRKRGLDLDWIEEQVRRREARPIRQPLTAIYSKSDAIVAWQAAVDHYSENVRHVEVDAAHLGMIFNPTVWRHIVAAMQDR